MDCGSCDRNVDDEQAVRRRLRTANNATAFGRSVDRSIGRSVDRSTMTPNRSHAHSRMGPPGWNRRRDRMTMRSWRSSLTFLALLLPLQVVAQDTQDGQEGGTQAAPTEDRLFTAPTFRGGASEGFRSSSGASALLGGGGASSLRGSSDGLARGLQRPGSGGTSTNGRQTRARRQVRRRQAQRAVSARPGGRRPPER